jgi:hypothetical protein
MKKIPTLFIRNTNDRSLVTDDVDPRCMWVIHGEGIATRKYDGTCCKIENGKLHKRREVKMGKPIPEGFTHEEVDPNTGKRVGWLPVKEDDPNDKYFLEAFAPSIDPVFEIREDGTYELLGPKVQGNPENLPYHTLQAHDDADQYPGCPRTHSELREWLRGIDIEGIVFHHPDGRMAKIKKRDFGLKRKPEEN